MPRQGFSHGAFMQTGRFPTIATSSLFTCAFVFFVFAATCSSRNFAADILLKNGTTLHGELLVSNSLADRFVGQIEFKKVEDKEIVVRTIGRMDNGWQRIYFPIQQRQILDSKQETSLSVPKRVVFNQFPKVIRKGNLLVAQFGSVASSEPFDDFGRRRVTIKTDNGLTPVFQSITEATPDHVIVTSTNFDWKLGLSLKSIPIETLEKLLRRQIKADDPIPRFALARFYTQAEYFPQAFEELDAIARHFPDKKELVENSQKELMNYFGSEILRRLGKRQRAGQHQLAEGYAKQLMTQPLSGSVQQDVLKYVRKYEESRQAIERVKLLLGDWQAKLSDEAQINQLQSLRSELNEQLDFETLPRLDAFLKAEADNQYEPAQRLGLAYSGWVLGPANAIPDLDQALRIWDARHLVLEALRTDDMAVQVELIKKLQSTENISPSKVVLPMIAQLPPILDASGVELGKECRVETASDSKIAYWVKLPAEYSPHHSYPLILALRPGHRSAEKTVAIWAGSEGDPDFAHQRGYIVIAPEYLSENTVEYSFGASAHKYVLDCLIDARKRFSVDSNRVFLAGHGMGGDAAFDIGFSHPDEFAGVVPLGGSAINYCNYTWENASHTALYVVGRGYDSNGGRSDKGDRVFDKIMLRGSKFDFMMIEYLGRNGENLIDDLPKVIDWMDLHVRPAQPKQFKVSSLRKTDNRFFWLTAGGLPHDYLLPNPPGEAQRITPMVIEGRILPQGNVITLKSPTKNYTLRLTTDLVDFNSEKRLVVKVGDRVEFNEFLTPDVTALLDELRLRGDRTRLPLAVITP